jgi:hypothetical protein
MRVTYEEIEIVPIVQRKAKKWVQETHRHLDAPQGDLYRTSLTVAGRIVAVGIAGRPCRTLQDGRTAEITRIASAAEVNVNACSRLYGALVRTGKGLGYRRFVTYTLPHEPGTSLRAAGFEFDGMTEPGEWSRPSRKRKAVRQPGPKLRWIRPGRASGLWDDVKPGKPLEAA